MSETRTLMNFQPVEQGKFLDRAAVETNVTDALRRSEARLGEMAQRYGVTGWVIDTTYGNNGYEYGLREHTVIGRLRLVRP